MEYLSCSSSVKGPNEVEKHCSAACSRKNYELGGVTQRSIFLVGGKSMKKRVILGLFFALLARFLCAGSFKIKNECAVLVKFRLSFDKSEDLLVDVESGKLSPLINMPTLNTKLMLLNLKPFYYPMKAFPYKVEIVHERQPVLEKKNFIIIGCETEQDADKIRVTKFTYKDNFGGGEFVARKVWDFNRD